MEECCFSKPKYSTDYSSAQSIVCYRSNDFNRAGYQTHYFIIAKTYQSEGEGEGQGSAKLTHFCRAGFHVTTVPQSGIVTGETPHIARRFSRWCVDTRAIFASTRLSTRAIYLPSRSRWCVLRFRLTKISTCDWDMSFIIHLFHSR